LHAAGLRGDLDDISMNGIAFFVPDAIGVDEFVLLRICNHAFDIRIDISG